MKPGRSGKTTKDSCGPQKGGVPKNVIEEVGFTGKGPQPFRVREWKFGNERIVEELTGGTNLTPWVGVVNIRGNGTRLKISCIVQDIKGY